MSSEDSSGDEEHKDKRSHCGARKLSPIETHNKEGNPFPDYSYANLGNFGITEDNKEEITDMLKELTADGGLGPRQGDYQAVEGLEDRAGAVPRSPEDVHRGQGYRQDPH